MDLQLTVPLISVVIVNYNYGRYLEDAIRSILIQGLGSKVEIIICDGGSTDCSIDVIKKYSSYIAWWCSESDGGQSNAFNKGFSHAKGKFLTWLNADDVLLDGALKEVAKLIYTSNDCEWIAGSTFWADAKLRVTRCFCAHKLSKFRALHCMLSVGGPSSFFSRELYERAGGYIDESFHYCMDTELWYRFYMKCDARFARTRTPLFTYRMHEESKMSGADVSDSERAVNNRIRSKQEGRRIAQMYGLDYDSSRFFVKALTFSLIDAIFAFYYKLKYKGRLANEI